MPIKLFSRETIVAYYQNMPTPLRALSILLVVGSFLCLVVMTFLSIKFGQKVGAVVSPGVVIIAPLLISYFHTAKSVVVRKRRAERRCVGCNYSLLNLTEPRCPECGTAFEKKE